MARAVDGARVAVDRRFGVCALGERADSILMWSHYADEHAGICIEFDTEAHAAAFPGLSPVRVQETTRSSSSSSATCCFISRTPKT